ncbi:MAG: hypothetical protein MMC33_003744 [Icmadophila ericetorum]|nr:hypothetical protein [Icmadophila ericetorum]
MPLLTVTIPKLVGSISLGLLTGLSYSLSTITVPPLLALPTFPPALQSFTTLKSQTTRHHNLLTLLSSLSLVAAYISAPRSQRQPFLLWCLSTTFIGFMGVDWFYQLRESRSPGEGRRVDGGGVREQEINGESVKEEMEHWRRVQMVRGGVWGLGFGMSIVGLWGDAYM